MNFQDLSLNKNIISALQKKGYVKPTPIQAGAIPHILQGRDFLGIAQTGTGKTGAFSLPIIDLLSAKETSKPKANFKPRALILSPTRELTIQIFDNIKLYSQDLNLISQVVYGGVSDKHQIENIKNGVDIIVATPGRLLDLVLQRVLDLSMIEIFVLDEADRMLDMGFIDDIKKIIKYLPTQRQNLFFSATMPKAISALSHQILKDPAVVEISPESTTVERISQSVYLVDSKNKKLLLKEILDNQDLKTVLVFCKTKNGANQLARFLASSKISAGIIHGNKSQSARQQALEQFRQGQSRVLIATDIASRGIDITGISHVINYDMPLEPQSYVHRIGRTARAGQSGVAISFCDTLEIKFLREIERTIGKKIAIDDSFIIRNSSSISSKNIENKNNNNEMKQQNIRMEKNNNFVARKISSAKNNHNSLIQNPVNKPIQQVIDKTDNENITKVSNDFDNSDFVAKRPENYSKNHQSFVKDNNHRSQERHRKSQDKFTEKSANFKKNNSAKQSILKNFLNKIFQLFSGKNSNKTLDSIDNNENNSQNHNHRKRRNHNHNFSAKRSRNNSSKRYRDKKNNYNNF